MKVYVIGHNKHYAEWFATEVVDCLDDADVVVFTGGADVYPDLYDEPVHTATFYDEGRDAKEMDIFERAVKQEKALLGICRGSQFLTVMNKGRLIQDVRKHASFKGHDIVIPEINVTCKITSTHHQMMYPFDMPAEDYKIIAHTPDPLSGYYQNGYNEDIDLPDNFVEPEIVYYPKTNSLAIQGHPEMMPHQSPTLGVLRSLIDKYLI